MSMTPVQIGVLVAMIVVFLIIASILIYLIVRWGHWKRRKHFVCVGDDNVLHFLDLSRSRQSLHLREMDITDGAALQSAMATLCGLPDPSILALCYTNEAGCVVDVDLGQLVAPDADLPRRMRQSAARPLSLTRRTPMARPQTPIAAHQTSMGKPSTKGRVAVEASFRDARRHADPLRYSPRAFVPPPVILPKASRITTATPVTVHTAPQGSGETASADFLHYTVDNTSSAQWYEYREAIFLPPGRWCVRAEASNADHSVVETTSRVFTVNVAERSH